METWNGWHSQKKKTEERERTQTRKKTTKGRQPRPEDKKYIASRSAKKDRCSLRRENKLNVSQIRKLEWIHIERSPKKACQTPLKTPKTGTPPLSELKELLGIKEKELAACSTEH